MLQREEKDGFEATSVMPFLSTRDKYIVRNENPPNKEKQLKISFLNGELILKRWRILQNEEDSRKKIPLKLILKLVMSIFMIKIAGLKITIKGI